MYRVKCCKKHKSIKKKNIISGGKVTFSLNATSTKKKVQKLTIFHSILDSLVISVVVRPHQEAQIDQSRVKVLKICMCPGPGSQMGGVKVLVVENQGQTSACVVHAVIFSVTLHGRNSDRSFYFGATETASRNEIRGNEILGRMC